MMTAATTSRSLSAAFQRRDRVGWADLAWLVWRQHRTLIAVTTLGVAIVAGLLWWDAADLHHASAYPYLENLVMPAAAGVIGMFWGAPLIAGEREQRTHLVVWSQDVSPVRWLTAKLIVLGGVAVVLATILGLADTTFINAISRAGHPAPDQYSQWGFAGFESWIPLQIMYALFGFALGVAVSALLRRTVGSIAVTLVVFAAARFAVGAWRLTFLPPLRHVQPPSGYLYGAPEPGAVQLGLDHIVNAAGNDISLPNQCYSMTTGELDLGCARAHGAVAAYVDYQPPSRLLPFHLIELGIFAVLTAILLTVAVRCVRRPSGATPSSSPGTRAAG
jgi:hypothetical protein